MSTGRSKHEWKGPVVTFLEDIAQGTATTDEISGKIGALFIQLVAEDRFDGNLGAVQEFLGERKANVQLLARRYQPVMLDTHGLESLDIVTGMPRGHWLSPCVGERGSALNAELAKVGMSHEVNIATLTNDTGILTQMFEA